MTCDRRPARAPVIVLNWNGWENTFDCLHSLAVASDVGAVWLVDNGSPTNRADEALAIMPELRLISLSQNIGFAAAMNHAMRIALAEGYVFAYLLNNDCKVRPGFLQATLDAACDSKVGIVGSRLVYADNSNSLIFDGEFYVSGEKPVDDSSRVRKVSQANGAGMLIRLTAVEQDGYFDERFFCYHEERELCDRWAARGWSCVIADASLVVHKREGSDVNNNALYYRTRNIFLLAETSIGRTRLHWYLDVFHRTAVAGQWALQHDRSDQLSVLGEALSDGLGGRFGQRPVSRRGARGVMMLRTVVILLPVFRSVRALSNWLKQVVPQ